MTMKVSKRNMNGMMISYGDEIDPNARTKQSHPYSYDPIVQYVKSGAKPCGSVYTDRMMEWDFSKHNSLCEKHFGDRGQRWDCRSPKLIEAFLRDWYEDPEMVLCAVIEYCNVSNGYPTWRLDYFQKPVEKE